MVVVGQAGHLPVASEIFWVGALSAGSREFVSAVSHHHPRGQEQSVLIKPQSWERHGLKPWIEAAKKRLHRNVLDSARQQTGPDCVERSSQWPKLRGEAGHGVSRLVCMKN